MTMKYNRALDLLAASALYAKGGRINAAAKAFNAAVKEPSLTAALKVIEASNKAALRANDQGIDADEPGQEFRVDVEENGDRTVQEASLKAKSLRAKARRLLAAADDVENGGDAELDFLDSEEPVEADADEDGDLDIGEFDEVEEPAVQAKAKAKVKASASIPVGAFARAVRNLNALSK